MTASDNRTRADNQQERLVKIGWVVGFVDGEGCFSIGFVKQPDRDNRRGYITGYQIFHEFAVTQGQSSLPALEDLQKFFGIGKIYVNKRYDNHKEHLYRYVVRKREDLFEVIIPFFQNYRLKTSKAKDFDKFSQCMEIVNQGRHVKHDGMLEIAQLVETMNHKKSKQDLIRILRDYMSDPAPVLGAGKI